MQVAVLVAGFLCACFAYQRTRPTQAAMLALCVMPIWIILVARELSWGAVFAAPVAFARDGPVFSSSLLWYKPIVAPAVILLLVCSAYTAWRNRLGQFLFRIAASGRFPWIAILIAASAVLGSNCAEGRMECVVELFPQHALTFEELVELVAYMALVTAQQIILRENHSAAIPLQSEPGK
jgi:hypothetical protein